MILNWKTVLVRILFYANKISIEIKSSLLGHNKSIKFTTIYFLQNTRLILSYKLFLVFYCFEKVLAEVRIIYIIK